MQNPRLNFEISMPSQEVAYRLSEPMKLKSTISSYSLCQMLMICILLSKFGYYQLLYNNVLRSCLLDPKRLCKLSIDCPQPLGVIKAALIIQYQRKSGTDSLQIPITAC